jgi:demethylmenaquinone methyltransferase / 2-methoxy-6-polyprenyl-1,4-benzoquinol methylase
MDKPAFIRRMFEDIAFSYDCQNSVLSLRRDVSWRRELARIVRSACRGIILDAATGTSEVGIEICRQNPGARVVGMDISSRMLEMGRRKVRARGMDDRIHLGIGDGRRLPLKDSSVSAVSMAFGIRNIDERTEVLAEFRRVLQPGGQVLIMEFGYPDVPVLRQMYELYFNHVLPPVGNFLSKTDYAYTYLVESVRAFPDEAVFLREMEDAGFGGLDVVKLTFGIARIYSGIKAKVEF